MKLKIEPDAIPESEVLRVWMPIPRKDPLQPEVKLMSATPGNCVLAPEDSFQRTIFFETSFAEVEELEFHIEYEYVAYASYQEVNPQEVYQEYSQKEFHKKYTSELLPHIAFTPYLRKLGKEIVRQETNPYLKAWLIYKWITEHVSTR